MNFTVGEVGASGAPFLSDFSDFSISDFSSLSKVIALRVRISSRISGLESHLHRFHSTNLPAFEAFQAESARLGFLVLQLDTYSIIDNAPRALSVYRDVRIAFKAYPVNLKDHCILLFGPFNESKRPKDFWVRRAQAALKRAKRSGASRFVLDTISEALVSAEAQFYFFQALFDKLLKGSLAGRKSELQRRLILGVEDLLVTCKWYSVFSTLTVDDKNYHSVFKKGSTAWRDYVRNLDSTFAIAAYGSVEEGAAARARGEDFHQYFAVIERGSKTGRLHIHCLHFFKTLPKSFSDPNFGSRFPAKRDIYAMRKFWPHGLVQKHIAVRYACDSYTENHNWIWPIEGRAYHPRFMQPLEVKSSPVAVAYYVAKYIQKAYDKPKTDLGDTEEGCIWRTRISRRMGLVPLQNFVSQLTPLDHRSLLKSRLRMVVQQRSLPGRMLRRLLLRQFYQTLKSSPNLLRIALRLFKPREPLWKQIVSGIQNFARSSLPNYGTTEIRLSKPMVAFSLFSERFPSPDFMGLTYAVS